MKRILALCVCLYICFMLAGCTEKVVSWNGDVEYYSHISMNIDELNMREYVGAVDFVFAGTVDKIVSNLISVDSGDDLSTYQIHVDRNIKGKLVETVKCSKHGGLTSDGTMLLVYSDARMDKGLPEEGKQYVFMAYAQQDGSLLLSEFFDNRVCSDALLAEYTGYYKNEVVSSRQRFVSEYDAERDHKNSTFDPSSLNTDLDVNIFKETVHKRSDENVLVSPISVKLALAMTANGAAGETLEELESFFGKSAADTSKSLSEYSDYLCCDRNLKLNIANSIWYDKHMKLNSGFIDTSEKYFDAEIKGVDFNSKTVKNINKWVKNKTDGMIDRIADSVDRDTVMLLINAIAFDAEWENIYTEDKISTDDFTAYDGKVLNVSMMHSDEEKYIETPQCTGFIKDYKGGNFGFAALLPNEDVDIYEFIDSLTGDTVSDMLDGAEATSVIAAVPKFTCKFETEMVEDGVLSALGINIATDMDKADFSGISGSHPVNLYIQSAVHKTYIKVDERGTRAGAATAIEMRDGFDEKIKYVILNRPFVYMIVDNTTNTPLFMGVTLEVEN